MHSSSGVRAIRANESDSCDEYLIFQSVMFTIVSSLPHSQDGKQQEWGPGEVCGEAALIRSENRHTALLAGQQGARVLSLKRDSLEAILSCPLADYKSLRTSRRSVFCTLLSKTYD